MRSKPLLQTLFITLFSIYTAVLMADDIPTPTALKGGKIISAEEAKSLVGKAAFFDMRKAVSYGKGHLPSAKPLPYNQKSAKSENFDASLDKFDMAQLPADKSAAMVIYSDGPTGWKSYKAAVIAIRNGYSNVMWFRGETAEWEAKGFSYAQ
ncbi:MAG: rhodanese-like domain-containing protein [Gammaproteobacteria bacterium]|nr:rhodanese-like domain-containing protein [Gammaproteobacteria bacterium]